MNEDGIIIIEVAGGPSPRDIYILEIYEDGKVGLMEALNFFRDRYKGKNFHIDWDYLSNVEDIKAEEHFRFVEEPLHDRN